MSTDAWLTIAAAFITGIFGIIAVLMNKSNISESTARLWSGLVIIFFVWAMAMAALIGFVTFSKH